MGRTANVWLHEKGHRLLFLVWSPHFGEGADSFFKEARAALTHEEKYALFYPVEFVRLQFSIDDAPLGRADFGGRMNRWNCTSRSI
ncbi:MAG: hypothetical protein WCL08_05395 [Verrucomicrobiota bacterium]